MRETNFQFKPSQYYLFGSMTILVLTVLTIFFLPLSFLIKIALLLATLIYCGNIIYTFGLLKSKNSVLGIHYQGNKQWLLFTRNETYMAEICGQSTVTHCISILRFRTPKHFFASTCILLPDSLKHGQYQELLMRLRFE